MGLVSNLERFFLPYLHYGRLFYQSILYLAPTIGVIILFICYISLVCVILHNDLTLKMSFFLQKVFSLVSVPCFGSSRCYIFPLSQFQYSRDSRTYFCFTFNISSSSLIYPLSCSKNAPISLRQAMTRKMNCIQFMKKKNNISYIF